MNDSPKCPLCDETPTLYATELFEKTLPRSLPRAFGTSPPCILTSVEDIKKTADEKEEECNAWRAAIKSVRDGHYLMSFFCSSQVGLLKDLLLPRSNAFQFGAEADDSVPFTSAAPNVTIRGAPTAFLAAPSEQVTSKEDLLLIIPALGRISLREKLTMLETPAVESTADQLWLLGKTLDSCFESSRAEQRVPAKWRSHSSPARKTVGDGELKVFFAKKLDGRSSMLEYMLSLFSEDAQLPSSCQLLFCSIGTTRDELDAFLHRAFFAHKHELVKGRLFCLIKLDALSEASYLHLVSQLRLLMHHVQPRRFRIALLSEESDTEMRRIMTDLGEYVKSISPLKVPPMPRELMATDVQAPTSTFVPYCSLLRCATRWIVTSQRSILSPASSRAWAKPSGSSPTPSVRSWSSALC